MSNEQLSYYFDGSMVGLLSCVFRAFQFKEFQVQLGLLDGAQHGLFSEVIEVPAHEQHAQRVWSALQQKLSKAALKQIYFASLSESLDAYQHVFNYCIYVFQQPICGFLKPYKSLHPMLFTSYFFGPLRNRQHTRM